MGDFLAGFFAPLAFFWLILGYLQQGEELQNSTRALQQQAEELRNSVEHQRELVLVTRQQLDSELEVIALAQRDRTEAAKPRFYFEDKGSGMFGAGIGSNFDVVNKGGNVKNVHIYIEQQNALQKTVIKENFFGYLKAVHLTIFNGVLDNGEFLKITYIDCYDKNGMCTYRIIKKSNKFDFDLVEE